MNWRTIAMTQCYAFRMTKRKRILISWNIKREIIKYIQYWYEFSSIYTLYLIYQWNQKEFSVSIFLKYRVLIYKYKFTIIDLRNILKVNIMKIIEYLHFWMKLEIIKDLKWSIKNLTNDILSEIELKIVKYLLMMKK